MEKKQKILKIIFYGIIILIVGIFALFNKKDEKIFELQEINILKDVDSVIDSNEGIEKQENSVDKIKVHVAGAVNTPGVLELEYGARVEDAINLVGGLTENADISNVNLAYILNDEEKIYIPNREEKIDEDVNDARIIAGIGEGSINKTSKVNINKSKIEELKLLPGVGDSLAQKIISYREENGKFKTIDDLKKVNGIGDKKYENLKDLITV